ncbi:hypothetical protein RND71_023417 [Anisodus tanguticus]|uniref:Uncharacterized protein n=1 Tax=Anisodus tanguticus TaxID=243964 RepID=A0AAE1RUT5_9SOLA|nr:hypothetical protein RND71_023417 [Anisodus tanguticus]
MAKKLRESVTFLPLKDLRYSSKAQQGHTWFMSSMYDTHEEVEVQYQRFPSSASKGRLLCLKGEGDEFDRHTNIPTRSTINKQQCDKTSWSGMKHDGDLCPYFDDDKIGCNETYFSEWARGERIRKKE